MNPSTPLPFPGFVAVFGVKVGESGMEAETEIEAKNENGVLGLRGGE